MFTSSAHNTGYLSCFKKKTSSPSARTAQVWRRPAATAITGPKAAGTWHYPSLSPDQLRCPHRRNALSPLLVMAPVGEHGLQQKVGSHGSCRGREVLLCSSSGFQTVSTRQAATRAANRFRETLYPGKPLGGYRKECPVPSRPRQHRIHFGLGLICLWTGQVGKAADFIVEA